MFGTNILARLAISALLLSAGLPQAANAVTFISPSSTASGAQANPIALAFGQSYTTRGFQFIEAGTQFDNYYAFTTTASLGTITTASTLEADPVSNGPFGIAGLTIEWLGLAATTFTDPDGVLNSTAKLVAALTAGGPYILHVFGTALSDGGMYSLRLTTSAAETPSPVPLPPAILLLGSVLGGFAATRLRRRNHAGA